MIIIGSIAAKSPQILTMMDSPTDFQPLYSSSDYESFCIDQKRKGLVKNRWCDLPEMWEDELAFRAELKKTLLTYLSTYDDHQRTSL